MPAKNAPSSAATFNDVLRYAEEIGAEHAVKIRLSVVPLARASGKATHAILATPYSLSGRKLATVEREQCLWPGNTARTREGAEIYLLTRLASALAEEEERALREMNDFQPGELSPLEEYIANNKNV